ncbi:MAG: hypothetical protein DRH70_09475 [Candidatus Coatesbacteria bacterium]|nr:MAG: hypothetical protein DRH70_09475 [Candidatus Coatesbacteria bacterium]
MSLMKSEVDFANDVFKIVLMNNAYVFDQDAHAGLSDISASVLADGNGYVTGTLVLVGVTQDDVNDRGEAEFDDFEWTASGGSIGPANGAIIYDDTHTSDRIIGYIDFGSAQTATDGGTFKIANVKVRTT